MTGGGLLVLMLLVSWASLLLQGAALVHLLCQRASYDAERLAGRGYVRTAACRVLAAAIYSAVALLAVLGVRIPGAGMLGPEALVVLTVNQAIWLANSAMDIRLRYRLRRQEGGTMTHPDERAVPAHEHVEREDDPWAVAIPDHPGRTDSPEYVRSRTAHQEAPYPDALDYLVKRTRYKEGWRFTLEELDRGQHSKGLTLVILRQGPDSYHPERSLPVNHFFIVPAASYNLRSWQRWLFERIRDVESHEAAEFFQICDSPGSEHAVRPYAPLHGPGWDPYLIAEMATDEDRRTSFRGELNPGSP